MFSCSEIYKIFLTKKSLVREGGPVKSETHSVRLNISSGRAEQPVSKLAMKYGMVLSKFSILNGECKGFVTPCIRSFSRTMTFVSFCFNKIMTDDKRNVCLFVFSSLWKN